MANRAHTNGSGRYTIDADFPGGNILVDSIDGDQVRLQPDLRDTAGDWFYWCFRVRGAAGRTLLFHLTRQNPIAARGPAMSADAGRTWQWLGRGADDATFSYTFPPDANDVRFGLGMTYTQEHLDRFLDQLDPALPLRREVLCHSRAGRAVECLRLGHPGGGARHRILLTARHHACEMMASYTLEGLLAALLGDDSLGRWFQDNADLLVVPFVDKDGVEQGDQGKNRKPRDHNRDYAGQSIYPETAALRHLVPQWLGDAPLVQLDLHCPWIRGGINELLYQVGKAEPGAWQHQQRFAQALASARRGPLPYDPAHDLPFGQDWNIGGNYALGASCTHWASQLPNVALATTLEIPYANAGGAEVNQTSARALGTDIARALQTYLTTP